MSSRLTISPQAVAVFSDIRIPSTLVSTLKGLVDEALVTLDSKGFRLAAIDPARVSMIVLELPPESFLELRIEKSLSLGISTRNLELSITGARKADKYVLASDGEFVEIVVEGLPTRRFRFRSIEVPGEMPSIDLEFDVEAVVNVDSFSSAVKDIGAPGSYALFKAEGEEELEISEATGGRGLARLTRASGSLIDMRLKKPSSSSYEISYIEKALALARLASQLELSFSSDAPLRLNYPLAVGGTASFYLAPQTSS